MDTDLPWMLLPWMTWILASLLHSSDGFYLEYCEILDLTHPFNSETIYWPNNPAFKLDQLSKGSDRGFYYAANRFSAAEHGGTHVDAPNHFVEGKKSISDMDPFALIGEACVVDISEQAAKDPDYELTVKDLEDWEADNVAINDDCILVIHTGFSEYWPDKERYFGTENTEDSDYFHFPGVAPATAQWIVDNRAPKAIGIDTASIDHGQSKDFRSHQIFGSHDIPLIENLAKIGQLPPRHSSIIATVMPIEGGTGAPARVFAYGWDGTDDACRRHKDTNGSGGLLARRDMFGAGGLTILVALLVVSLLGR